MYYIFHGEDEFGCAEELTKLRARLAGGSPAMAELNTHVLDGRQVTLSHLQHACDTVPFLSDRRLVIVYGLLGRLGPRPASKGAALKENEEPTWKRGFLQDLAAYLPTLPPTTRLIFVESSALPAGHPILKQAEEDTRQEQAYVRLFPLPREEALGSWIRKRVEAKRGGIQPDAAEMLAALIGRDLRSLDQEIEKLLAYSDGQPITIAEVQLLVSRARESSVFDLVDTLGRRETDRALTLLHRLLDAGEAPLYLLAMLARHVRILLQASELAGQGLTAPQTARELGLHRYVAEKALQQVRNFNTAHLETAHQRLVETDFSIKTGKMDDVLALELLTVELSHRAGDRHS